MKVFVAGATGVLGRALVPQLVARGHEVVGMTRGPPTAQGSGTALLLGYLMYPSGLVPPRMALLGVIGGPLSAAGATFVLCSAPGSRPPRRSSSSRSRKSSGRRRSASI